MLIVSGTRPAGFLQETLNAAAFVGDDHTRGLSILVSRMVAMDPCFRWNSSPAEVESVKGLRRSL